jgi:hypothetical protein
MKEDQCNAHLHCFSPQINGEPFHLLLDCSSAYRTMDFKVFAVQLGSTLHSSPAGGTDQFQPLDRFIIGAIKSMTRRIFLQRIRDRPCGKVTKLEAVQMLIRAWTHVQEKTMEEAWTVVELNSKFGNR